MQSYESCDFNGILLGSMENRSKQGQIHNDQGQTSETMLKQIISLVVFALTLLYQLVNVKLLVTMLERNDLETRSRSNEGY